MDLFGVEELEICPWALREGVILRLTWTTCMPGRSCATTCTVAPVATPQRRMAPAPPAPRNCPSG